MKNVHIMAKDIFSICAIKVAEKEKKFEDCRGKVKPF